MFAGIGVMDSVRKARARLGRYPELLAACQAPASAYAACVVASDNVRKSECEREFLLLKQCLELAARKRGTRL